MLLESDVTNNGAPGFFDVVTRQRACRAFSDEPLDPLRLRAVLQAATFAPSAENRQPWVFVVVQQPAARAAIGELIRDIWETFGRDHTKESGDATLFRDVDRGLGHGGVASAPALIVVGGDTRLTDRSQIKASVYPAVQNMLLAAGALGLGTCLTTITSLRAERTRELVGFPAAIEPIALVPIGHPARPLGPPRREPIEAKAHNERFGRGWSDAIDNP
jgi:nitroreductase